MLRIPALALAGALSLAACDSDGGVGVGDLREGRFEGLIEGVLDGRLLGDALSGSSTAGYHDLIVLTDYAAGVEVTLYHVEDEFFEGRERIGDAAVFDESVVAWVEVLDTGEIFESFSGTLDIQDASSAGLDGIARFNAESTDFPGDVVSVEVAFRTFYDAGLDASLSPSFSASAKVTGR